MRGQAHGLDQLFLQRDQLLIQAVGLHDGLRHLGLGQFLAEPLDHHDRLLGARDDQVEIAVLEFLGRRERDQLALDTAQPDRAHGPQEGNPRQKKRRRGADHRRHVGIILAVGRNRTGLDLHLVAIPVGKERPNWPVDQPGGEDFLGGRPPLALDEAAGELPRGIRLLAVIDTQGEEIEPFTTRCGHEGDQRHRVADSHDHGTAGLLGEVTRLDAQQLAADGPFDKLAGNWIAGHGLCCTCDAARVRGVVLALRIARSGCAVVSLVEDVTNVPETGETSRQDPGTAWPCAAHRNPISGTA